MSIFRMHLFSVMKGLWLAAAALAIGAVPLAAQQKQATKEVKGPGLFIFFEGDQPGNTIAQVARTLVENQGLLREAALPLASRTVEPGDSICKYLLDMDYPLPCGKEILYIVERLNPTTAPVSKGLQLGKPVFLPDLSLTKYTVTRRLPMDSSQAAMPAIEKNWKELKAEIVRRSDGLAFLRFEAYRVFVPAGSEADAAKLFEAVAANTKSDNIKIDFVPSGSSPEKQHASGPPVTEAEWRNKCDSGALVGSAIWYRDLSATYGGPDPKSSPAGVSVHIIDGPINESDNLLGALQNSSAPVGTGTVAGPAAPATSPVNQPCNWTTFSKPQHHATHMASIIGSRNNYGLVGVAPLAKIVPFPWLKVDGQIAVAASPQRGVRLTKLIDQNNELPVPIPVYLIATEFPQPKLAPGQPIDRFRGIVASSIRGSAGFFVVAAGQTDEDHLTPVALSPDVDMSPQNLGDLENVVVVTACTGCLSANPKLLDKAHYSSGREQPLAVHVAAPGGSAIGGWVKSGQFAVANGTSQAAAFVAGLAGQMIGTYKEFYKDGLAVKKRLQTTSYPAAWSKDDEAKLSMGIVDPKVALLDPTKHWLKQDGTWKDVPIRSLSQGSFFEYRDGTTDDAFALAIPALLRVVRTTEGDPSDRRWDFYADLHKTFPDKYKKGMISRIRNRIPSGNLALCDGTQIAWQVVQDLIVSPTGVGCN
jgi:hypothetical protein